MGSDVEAPEPTAEERRLQAEQAELLRQQRDILTEQGQLQEALLPVFAAQSGIDLQFDDEGNVIGGESTFDPTVQTDLLQEQLGLTREQVESQRELLPMQTQLLEAQLGQIQQQQEEFGETEELRALQRQVEQRLAQRSLDALEGNLPVDPALERELEEQGETLRERLREQFGPGFETSSPGIEALQEFEESGTALRSAARRGQLTLAEQLGVARTQSRMQQQQSPIQSLQGLGLGPQQFTGGQVAQLPGMQTGNQQKALFNVPFNVAGGLGQTAGGFGAAQVPHQQQRQMEFDAAMFNAQNSGLGAVGSLFGSIIGAIPWSDRRLKKWADRIGELSNGTALYLFEYIWGEQRIGVMAQEVPWATVLQRGYLAVDYRRV